MLKDLNFFIVVRVVLTRIEHDLDGDVHPSLIFTSNTVPLLLQVRERSEALTTQSSMRILER